MYLVIKLSIKKFFKIYFSLIVISENIKISMLQKDMNLLNKTN